MVEGARLESVIARKGNEGSNPSLSAIFRVWRGDRVVEGARLEIVCGVYSVTEGSNPSLSAMNCVGGSSSIGRAPGSQSGGRGFDPHLLHHFL